MPTVDPITLAFEVAALALTSVPQIEALIARLQDHSRTLAAATADRKIQDDQLDADLANPPA